MKPTQYLIRFVVFAIIVLDPSSGGFGIALAIATGAAIGLGAALINAIRNREEIDSDSEDYD